MIVLVITIIVLLILAGVGIATLTGDNGILTKAKTAKKLTEEAETKEQIELAVIYSKMNNNTEFDKALLESELKNNLGTEITIIKNGTNEGLPWEITKGDYRFEISEDGTVTKKEASIIVSNLIVKNGETVLEENSNSVDIGTPLTINFDASIEGGDIIEVTPGTVTNGQVTYVTDGTEKEVTFTIVGKVNGENSESKKTISIKDKYEKSIINSTDISNNPQKYFGGEVSNYEVDSSVADSNIKWKIFYADGETDEDGNAIAEEDRHIYLIASDYIKISNAPSQTITVDEVETTYSLVEGSTLYSGSFEEIRQSGIYSGSANITDNRIKASNNSYFNEENDGNGYTSTSGNMSSVAYMLDIDIWSKYAMIDKTEYAIGTPTIELLFKSYNKKYSTKYLAKAVNANGYQISKDNGESWNDTSGGDEIISASDNLYVSSQYKTSGLWLASPSGDTVAPNRIMLLDVSGIISRTTYDVKVLGLRPVVCLNSNVQLEKQINGTYHII